MHSVENKMNSYNRRRSPRIPAQLPARLRHGDEDRVAQVVSINGHGLLVRAGLVVDVRERIGLTIELPDGPIQVIAIVRATVGLDGLGVELTALTEADRVRWRRHYALELRRLGVQRIVHEEAYL